VGRPAQHALLADNARRRALRFIGQVARGSEPRFGTLASGFSFIHAQPIRAKIRANSRGFIARADQGSRLGRDTRTPLSGPNGLEMAWMSEMAARHASDDATIALLTSAAGYYLLPNDNQFEHPFLNALDRHGLSLIEERKIQADVAMM
jgi:hypothetical protein